MFRLTYTSSPSWPISSSIVVLDSSFNPPHLAHLALASYSPLSAGESHAGSSTSAKLSRLLVISSKNADKVPKPGEPNTDDRLEMIERMARWMHEERCEDVAVAVVEAPTFCGKSQILVKELNKRSTISMNGEKDRRFCLTFVQGWDTIIRFFHPKYYTDMQDTMSTFFNVDNSRVACARRGDISQEDEEAFLSNPDVCLWKEKVDLFDLGDEALKGVSSTKIRAAVLGGDQASLEGLVLPGVAEVIEQRGFYKESQ
ncbi:Nucleotidylyl transferase [Meredithblackwellia eburnea MCA 4105]